MKQQPQLSFELVNSSNQELNEVDKLLKKL